MIASVIAVAGIAVIWLMGGRDIAQSELLIRSAEFVALVCLSFPIIYVLKLFTIPEKEIQLTVASKEPFETVSNRICTVRAKLQSNIRTEISNGSLQLINLNPRNNGNDGFLLKGDLTIAPMGVNFIDVASYSEVSVGSRIVLSISEFDGVVAPATFGNLPVRSHTFCLKFLSLSGISDEICCRLFVGSDHVLHLEEWANVCQANR